MRVFSFASLVLAMSSLAVGCGGDPDAIPRAAPLEQAAPAAPAPSPTAPAPDAISPAITQLPAVSRAALDSSPVPMLVPPASYAPRTIVTSGEQWAAFSYHDGELTISLHATGRSHPVIGDEELLEIPPADQSVRGEPARMTVNELIRSVAWEENGVAYALEVECARPEHDPRCTEPEFLFDLAETLVAAPRGAR